MEHKIYDRNMMGVLDLRYCKGWNLRTLMMGLAVLGLVACDAFLEVDPPKDKLVSETVFADAATVESALANIYFKIREQGMVSGNFGLSIAMGAYADELDYYGSNANQLNLYNHTITAYDDTVAAWWRHAYNLIYAANDIIQGVDNSEGLTAEARERFKGQALFIRAYLHSLLVGLYGDVPYVTTTDYRVNNTVPRQPVDAVYGTIIADLVMAKDLLADTDASGERVIPNRDAAKALLARMYLYHGDFALAETLSSEVIANHTLETDINKEFLKEASGTLWQLKPGEPGGNNTQEGQRLVITFVPTQGYALTDKLLAAFEPGDLRKSHWVGSVTSEDGLTTLYYAHKYKETLNTTTESLEYSIVFRLAEQYLIRAEARAQLGDIPGAQEDINILRNRAGLEDTTAATKEALLEAIIHERQVELFTEHGHRWFDLKRFGKAAEALEGMKSNWQDSDVLLPIPGTELEVNPNLNPQNMGY